MRRRATATSKRRKPAPGRGAAFANDTCREPLQRRCHHERVVRPIKNAAVARAFAAYPPKMRRKLMVLRALILKTAASTDGVGPLEETLKWGEPAYATSETRSGSTIRVAWKKVHPTQYAMYFHCQTNLVDSFRARFPKEL